MRKTTLITAAMMAAISMPAMARDFMNKESCTLAFKGRAPVHTSCLIKGGMQGGAIDISISTPDGKIYSLEGPIDGEDGHKFLLQKHPATKISHVDDADTCYTRIDGYLVICLTPADDAADEEAAK